MPNLAYRLISAAIIMPILFTIIWMGSPWFSILTALIASIGTLELSNMAHRWGDKPIKPIAITLSITIICSAHLISYESTTFNMVILTITIAAPLSLIWLLWHSGQTSPHSKYISTICVAIYTGGFLFYAPLLRSLENGMEWLFFTLLIIFATDTCAYLVGKSIGKRPLASIISPSKTWEGACGGIIGAIVISFAIINFTPLNLSTIEIIMLSTTISVLGQFGDLIESNLKRRAKIKNSGRLVLGHGGVLDRIDSIVPNLLVVYYFAV